MSRFSEYCLKIFQAAGQMFCNVDHVTFVRREDKFCLIVGGQDQQGNCYQHERVLPDIVPEQKT